MVARFYHNHWAALLISRELKIGPKGRRA